MSQGQDLPEVSLSLSLRNNSRHCPRIQVLKTDTLLPSSVARPILLFGNQPFPCWSIHANRYLQTTHHISSLDLPVFAWMSMVDATWAQGGVESFPFILLRRTLICCYCTHHINTILSSSCSHQIKRSSQKWIGLSNFQYLIKFFSHHPSGLKLWREKETQITSHISAPQQTYHPLHSVWYVEVT